ncbi:unnamed protein product, partial [Rotaria magnacalcarata]
YRIVLEKDTLDLWVNGQRVEAEAEFTDEGTETIFDIAGHPAILKAVSSGRRNNGLHYTLLVDGCDIPPTSDNENA